MGAFKQNLKKVYEADCSGLTSITVDGVFLDGHHYLILGDSFYYQTTGTHMFFYLRKDGTDVTSASYQRGGQTAQHGQSSLLINSDAASGNGGNITYVGNSADQSGGFKLWYYNAGYAGTKSYRSDTIGHVNGTGYRGQSEMWTKLEIAKYDGFKITFNGFTADAGNIRVYEINMMESSYLDNE